MPVRALVAAADLFGISENSVRVTLARLLADRLIARDDRGAYRLGPGAEAVSRQVASWRDLGARMRPWDGGWLAVHTAGLGRANRTQLRRRTRALSWLGFRELRPALAVRPDNLAGGVDAVRTQLRALGLEPDALVFVVAGLDEATDRSARLALEHSERRLPALPEARAMVESFELGGNAIRQLALDPLLPDALLPGRERELLLETMLRYDRAGRACWARFLGGFGVGGRPSTAAEVRQSVAAGG